LSKVLDTPGLYSLKSLNHRYFPVSDFRKRYIFETRIMRSELRAGLSEAVSTGLRMSEHHHHHPHEGHSAGRKPLHHNWFFWVAGIFILLALIGFIVEGSGALRPSAPVEQPSAASGSGK
jgi:hypothetical protein